MLEKQMMEMRELPARMSRLESQIVQLRQEMRGEFSATRTEFRAEIETAVTTVRDQLREQIHAASARTETLMRVLHEEALSRIATVGERRRTKPKK